MLTFKKDDKYQPLANIINANDKVMKTVYLTTDKNKEGGFKELNLPEGQKFQIIPSVSKDNIKKQRQVIFVAGQSGSGKSYYTDKYVNQYKKKFPNNPVYLISKLTEDETLDANKHITRINIYHDDFLEDDISYKDFANSLVIMDDIDAMGKNTNI